MTQHSPSEWSWTKKSFPQFEIHEYLKIFQTEERRREELRFHLNLMVPFFLAFPVIYLLINARDLTDLFSCGDAIKIIWRDL